MALAQYVDGALRPDGPLAKQAAGKVERAAVAGGEWCQQVGHDRVIVPGVKRDVIAPAVGERARDVEGAVAIERGDLHGDDAVDVEEAAPEGAVEHAAANGGLQIEP